MNSPSIVGADITATKSFAPTFTTSASTAARLQSGGYEVTPTQDVDLVISKDNSVVATALPATQPADSAAQVCRIRLFANQKTPVDIPEGEVWYWSAIGVSAGGTLVFNGPLRRSFNR